MTRILYIPFLVLIVYCGVRVLIVSESTNYYVNLNPPKIEIIQPKPTKQVVASTTPAIAHTNDCSCVLYLRNEKRVNIHGDAIKQIPDLTIQRPVFGDVAIFNYSGIGHVGITKGVSPNGRGFFVEDFNYRKCQKLERFVSFDDPALRGFRRYGFII